MEKITSAKELAKLKKQYSKEYMDNAKTTRILVGMATCGYAAGAGDVFDSIAGEIMKQGLKNIQVVRTGCMGACHSEPTVEVRRHGEKPVVYGNINSAKAKTIVKSHIINGEVVDEYVIDKDFETID